MSREKKTQLIENLQEFFSRCNIGILTDYRGLSTAEMTALRRRLSEAGIDYKVVKNTLARLAAERAGKNDLLSSFEGPIAIAFGYADITEPARVLADYIAASKASLDIRGGFLKHGLLTAEEVITLSKLPTREVLLAMVVGGMQAPIYGLLNLLTAPMRGLITILQARIQQLEGE